MTQSVEGHQLAAVAVGLELLHQGRRVRVRHRLIFRAVENQNRRHLFRHLIGNRAGQGALGRTAETLGAAVTAILGVAHGIEQNQSGGQGIRRTGVIRARTFLRDRGPCRDVSSGRGAHDGDLGRIDAQLGRMFLHPAHRGARIGNAIFGCAAHALARAVIGRHSDHAQLGCPLRPSHRLLRRATGPTAAEEHDEAWIFIRCFPARRLHNVEAQFIRPGVAVDERLAARQHQRRDLRRGWGRSRGRGCHVRLGQQRGSSGQEQNRTNHRLHNNYL